MSESANELLLTGGRIINPATQYDQPGDLLLRQGRLAAFGPDAGREASPEAQRIDVAGQIVCPGLIDLHVHFRDPGQTRKENVLTGAQCAARGGFTSVVCMPNTTPAIDNPGTVALLQERAKAAQVNVFVAGALTKDIAGTEMAAIGALAKAGVVALSDDGHCVQNHDLMRRACEYARMFGLPVMDHCQDYSLVQEGMMHDGWYSTMLGLAGWPSSGEELIVARNILLAEQTGTPIHCQHISAAGSVRLIREARKRGVSISGEASPHHFTLTDATIAGSSEFWATDGAELARRLFAGAPLPEWPAYHTHFKMNPPLRTATDREAVLEGLVDGTLEIIASDHAPHTETEKEKEFAFAPFGILGLEVELALALTQLFHTGRLSLVQLLAKLTCNPARFLQLADHRGTLTVGGAADVTVFDANAVWVSRRDETASKSRNNPFHEWPLRGRPTMTVVAGKVVWERARPW